MTESRSLLVPGAALVLVALVSALAVMLAVWATAGSDGEGGAVALPSGAEPEDPIVASATLDPRIVLFGDTLTAHVDVLVDSSVVDPERIEVSWKTAPWSLVTPPGEKLRVAGSTAHLRTTFVLRCLAVLCVPARAVEQIDFDPARVTYAASAGEASRPLSIDVPWPTLVVHTRITELDPAQRDALAAPWRADLVSLPAVSYRVAPALVVAIAVGLGALLVAFAGFVVYRARPRREPEPEPEPPPLPVATPLELALALLESEAETNGAQERRRALELVADEVEQLGDPQLALTARELAWSQHGPDGDDARAVAALLRTRLESVNGGARNGRATDDPV